MTNFMLKMPIKLHKALKIYAVMNGITMSDFIIEAIKEKLEKQNA